jgi:hydrogenase/urease accessory protein HupE
VRALSAIAALLFVLLAPSPAGAHSIARSYCTVRTVVGGLDVGVETAAHLLGQPLGLGTKTPADAELTEASERLVQQLLDRIQARTPNGDCRASAKRPELVTRDGERAVRTDLEFHCPPGPVTLRNSWRLDVDPASESMCAIDGAAWVFRIGLEELEVGTPRRLAEVLRAFVGLGAVHVFGGIDHVLFVIVLLVAAAIATETQSLRHGLYAVAGVVTGFTLGHSVTLILAGLELVRLDTRLTESVIALSIVVVGVENVLARRIRWRFWTACVFGLVHGFGFAAVLSDTELPRRGTVWALLAFNLGIELAQLAIVVCVFPLLALAARQRWYRRLVLAPVSIAVAAVALVWFVKRAAGLQFLPWLGS